VNSVRPQSKQTIILRKHHHGGLVYILEAGEVDDDLRTKLLRFDKNASAVLAFYVFDVKPKPSQHYPDCDEGHTEPDTAMVPLNHCFLPSFQVLGGDCQASLNILIYQVLPEAVDRDPSFCQRIPCLVLSQPSLAHLHAGGLGDTENLVSTLDGFVQSTQSTLKSCPCLITNVAWFMTLHTDSVRTSAKLSVSWMADAMIAMTHDAPWKRRCLKGIFV
jgi:hypothetical protein